MVKEQRKIRNAKIKERISKDARSSIFVKAGSSGVKRLLSLRRKQ